MWHGSYHTQTGRYHIYDEPFSTKISSFTIITRSCILGDKVLKMNDYLTYFGAEISNVQFLCHFAFSFFKFWIIPSPSCNSFKCTRISKRNGTSLLWNSSMLFLRLTYPQTVLFLMREGSSKGTLESFWHNIHFLNTFFLLKEKQ